MAQKHPMVIKFIWKKHCDIVVTLFEIRHLISKVELGLWSWTLLCSDMYFLPFRDDDDPVRFLDETSDSEEDEAPKAPKARAPPRQKWDAVETAELRKYFKEHLEAKTTPRSKEIDLKKKKSQKNGGKLYLRRNDLIIKKISAMNHK